jgi:hypothetical protein
LQLSLPTTYAHSRFHNEDFGESYAVSLADHNGFTTSDKAIIDVNV